MIKSLIEDFLNLIYPRTCAACGNTLFRHEEVLCSHCLIHLPKTFFHTDDENPLSMIFWGKIPFKMITAFYYYNKGNKVQNLVHQLKYNKRADIGIYLGERYGQYLNKSPYFKDIDLIIPVPLHEKKMKIRGYNQAEMFAKGLSKSMKIPYDTTTLIRNTHTETQTKKSKEERWENVKGKFSLNNKEELEGKHMLLVDDVITTGATMESCARTLLEAKGAMVSFASIAAAHH
ncbi:MAG: amidophosphoribosyltransferase [Bacteroidetes bacterium 4572_77]|nr:MAG: amidophosphoribosyltransferase [Bacteroidetes bacterium 4572_77]